MPILTALHVISVFIAFAFTAGVGAFQSAIAASHDVRATLMVLKP